MMRLLSVLAVLVTISMVPTVLSEAPNIDPGSNIVPSWVKNTAGWWASDQIPDSAFLQGIQFLLKEEIIVVPIPAVDSVVEEGVPGWVKNTAGWWAEDKIHDIAFLGAIKYLISQGIITIEQEVVEAEVVEEYVEEVAEISDFYMEVNGSNCCVNWTYVGKEYNFQIETYDEKNGKYIDGIKINVKIISKGGEIRHNFGEITTEDGVYKNSITIPSLDWYAENILSVTGEYYGVEKTIEKEFTVLARNNGGGGAETIANTAGSCTEGYTDEDGDFQVQNEVSVTTQENSPQSIVFGDDGRKMFVMGRTGDDVNEYTLAGPYCLPTISFVDASAVGEDGQPHGLAFSNDGLKMFVAGKANNKVFQYSLTENFDASTATHNDKFCNITNQDTGIEDVVFSNDGLKMFVMGNQDSQAAVYQYSLTENFDVSTCSYNDKTVSVESRDNTPTSLAFSGDGLKMFVLGSENNKVYQYTLGDNFDITTATFASNCGLSGEATCTVSIATKENNPRGMTFDPSGKYLFIVGSQGADVNLYKLTENFDVSTAVFVS